MDVIERGVISLKTRNKLWNIPLISLIDHLNGKTWSKKVGSLWVISKEEKTIVLQECELYITTTQNEDGKNHTNLIDPILKWDVKKFLVILVLNMHL